MICGMTDPMPWPGDAAGAEALRHAPATVRNRDAITDVLRNLLPERGTVLEIASGSGEHAVHFARAFPGLVWQPSDRDPPALASIAAWTAHTAASNVLPPLMIDVEQPVWPIDRADAIVCINMVHISPWGATRAVFARAAALLAPGAPLFFYGPYTRDDVTTSDSNLAFDASLRQRDPRWGLRDVADMDALAQQVGFDRLALVEMPANNLSLVYRRA